MSDDAIEALLSDLINLSHTWPPPAIDAWAPALRTFRENATDDVKRAAAEIATAMATDRADARMFLVAAVLRAQDLTDPASARATLEAGETTLTAHAQTVFRVCNRWSVLAEAWLRALDDVEGCRRCLRHAWAATGGNRDQDDAVYVLYYWQQLLGVDEASSLVPTLVQRAQMANRISLLPGAMAPWGLPDALTRGPNAASLQAAEFSHGLHDAATFHRENPKHPAIGPTLKHAETLTTSPGEGIELAGAVARLRADASWARQVLDRVRAMPLTPDQMVDLASAYWGVLNDRDAALALNWGVRPETPELFDFLRARVTPANLRAVAAADYGMDEDEHFAALEMICTTGLVPPSLPWQPHEVCALNRWSTGERVVHVQRALSCLLLCLADNVNGDFEPSAPVLMESCVALGADALQAAEPLFVWVARRDPNDVVACGVANLLLVILRVMRNAPDAEIEPVVQTILTNDHEDLVAEIDSSMRQKVWYDLISTLPAPLRARLGL